MGLNLNLLAPAYASDPSSRNFWPPGDSPAHCCKLHLPQQKEH